MAARSGGGVSREPGKFYDGLCEELTAFAEHEFRLGKPDKQGVTARDHWLSIERQTGRRPADLDGPPLPDELAYLWAWFCEIQSGASQNGMGPMRVTHLDLMAWQWNSGVRLAPRELRCLTALGTAWVKAMCETTASIARPEGAKHGRPE